MASMQNITEHVNVSRFDPSQLNFGAVDYTLFAIMLGISASIGFYFGFIDKHSDTAEEYLVGGRKMKTIPIAISLVSSQLSCIAITTIPAEIYSYGMHYFWHFVAVLSVLPVLLYVIVPVFYSNNTINCYEYLEARFDRRTRKIVTFAFLLKIFLIVPVYIFIPSLVFSQVSGINIHIINVAVSSVCIFYTMLGGIKAVVWTDVVQALIMLSSVTLVAILAVVKVGGITEVFNRASAGGRLYMTDFTLDLTTRATVWNTFFGGAAYAIAHIGVHQSCVQRIIALPSLAQSRKSLIIFAFGFLTIMAWNSLTGIVMYARYYLCDPLQAGIVDKQDKMLPFFVQDTIGHLKGMPGVFISCVFSAALSTVSANMNTVAGIIYFDYIRPHLKKDQADKKASFYMKLIVFVFGIYGILVGFIVENFKSIFPVAVTVTGISQGAVAGVFLLGMLVPFAKAKAAFYGTVFSMLSVGFIAIGSQYHLRNNYFTYDALPVRFDSCLQEFNVTTSHLNTTKPEQHGEDLFILFRVSYFWYIFLGLILVWIFAIPYSILIKDEDEKDKKLDLNLMSPVIHKWIPKSWLLQHEEIPLKE